MAAFAVALAGCAVDLDAEQHASVEQALFQPDGVRLWNYDRVDGFGRRWGANTIPVCFETGLAQDNSGFNGNTSLVPNFATYSRWIREAVEDSWGRVANLRFVHWGQCPERVSWLLSGWVAIYWSPPGVGGGSVNGLGYMSTSWTRVELGRPGDLSRDSELAFKAVVRHEFGHVLGFQHEKDRADYSGWTGTSTPDASCQRTATAGTGWTEVYDPTSIMNYGYCNEAGSGELSPYDIYGVQRAYGRKPSGSIVGLGGRCVNTPGFNYTNGTILQAYDCYGQSNDTWTRYFNGGVIAFWQSSSALSSRSPHQDWGTWTELQSYSGNTMNNIWRLSAVHWRAIGNMCVAVRNPDAGDNRLIIEKCQQFDQRQLWDWDYGVKGRIRNVYTGTCVNVANASSATHTPINVYPCGTYTPAPNEVFTTTSRGEIKWADKCFNVANYFPVAGAELQLYPCAPAGTARPWLWYNELFHLSGRITHAWWSDVLTLAGGVSTNGALIQTYPDVWQANQEWEIYF